MYQADDDDVDGLLRLLASKLAQDADVAAVALAAGSITMSHDGAEHLLYLPRDVIAARLADMRRGEHPWESDISAQEALTRLMTVHLFESFATRVRHETGW